jgi:long-chain acyl-CoA synthetase
MSDKTLYEYFQANTSQHPDKVWLRERLGDEFTEWTWQQAHEQISAAAAWLEKSYGSAKTNIALLSRNRAHWFFADLAIIGSGNVTVPLFTTLNADNAKYILEFAEVSVLFLGETTNWDVIRSVLPAGVEIITLPGVDCDLPCRKWDDIVAECTGLEPQYQADIDDLISIVFTSGTTGVPKGSLQTHRSSVVPVDRLRIKIELPDDARAFSYLPLAHIAERHLVEFFSVMRGSQVTFNESLETLIRDLAEAQPHFLFGAPRVWELLQQAVIASFGSAQELEHALATDSGGTSQKVREMLGVQHAISLLSAAAPAATSMLEWYAKLGMNLVEGFGQTEAMGLLANTSEDNRIGSIGKAMEDVEIKIGENDEFLVRADGLSPGYYKMPEKTAELWQDGWLHTGDKARIDEDGYVFLFGRVKDYFKTIHGKFVAPAPIENDFAACTVVEQLCLLGRGYSKTVMVCVVNGQRDKSTLEQEILEQLTEVNTSVNKHERIGAIIITSEPWTIENGVLTPTLKIRRDEVEARFGEKAQVMARESAEQRTVLVEWA